MLITIAIIIIVILTFLLIMYNMYADYQSRREADLRAMVNRARNTVNDTEDLLANQSNIPYSKTTVLVLRYRILNALKRIKQDPNSKNIDNKIAEQLREINDVKANYFGDLSFKPPETDAIAINQLRAIRKIRKIIQHEIRVGGSVDRIECIKDDKRLGLLVIKINISNLIQRVVELKRLKQIGTCRQLIEKGLDVINRSGYKDEWLNTKADLLMQLQQDIEVEVKNRSKKATEEQIEKQTENEEIDQLFADKKKW